MSKTAKWRTDTPPAYQRVLMYVEFDRFTFPKIMAGWHDGESWKWENGSLSGTVTHWQPLPEPPGRRVTGGE